MFVLNILLGLAMWLWIMWLWSRRKYYKLMFQLPGPIGLPLIGVLYKLRSLEDIYLYSREVIKTHTFPLLSWIGPFPIFGVMDPQNAQDILTSPHCVNKADHYSAISEVLGHGLLNMPNPAWSAHRKLLNPSFNSENQRNFIGIFNARTKTFLQDFQVSYDGESIHMLPLLFRVSMKMALETTMGLKSVDKNISDIENMQEKLFGFYEYLSDKIMSIAMMPWLRLKIVQKLLPSFKEFTTRRIELKKFFQNVINEKLELLAAKDALSLKIQENVETSNKDLPKKQSQIFIDIAVELFRNGKFTIQEVEDQANHIVAGASETTAITVAHALMLLAMNPQYQEIVFDELISLYADRDDVTVKEEDLPILVYLEMVINETMRLVPTVPIAARLVTSDIRLSSGIIVPAGVQVVIDLFDLHRNESVWGPNAKIFNPENFLPENLMDKHPYAFIPFTKGIRNCIGHRYGMNATKIMLAMLLRKYRFSTSCKFENLRFEPTVTTRIINPPPLKVYLREK